MTRARDLSKLLGTNNNGVIDNSNITLDANEVPNLDASKITTGELANARVADLPASKITSGTFADARISQSSVTQHSTPFDDSKIQQDLMVLALQQATDANKAAYSLSNSFIEQFEDATGIDVQTNTNRNASEYISTITAESFGTLALVNTADRFNKGTLSSRSFGTNSIIMGSSPDEDGLTTSYNSTTPILIPSGTPFQFEWVNSNSTSRGVYVAISNSSNLSGNPSNISSWHISGSYVGQPLNNYTFQLGSVNTTDNIQRGTGSGVTPEASITVGNSSTFLITGDSLNYLRLYENSTLKFTSANQQNFERAICVGNTGGHASTASSVKFALGTAGVANATGNFTSVSKTAPATVSKMGIVVLYKNNAGTATLNTDLVAQVSANNGTNYTTVTLTPRGTFSTGINIAVANNVTVTSGTSCKYKISFANQSSGTKETQVHGVGLIY